MVSTVLQVKAKGQPIASRGVIIFAKWETRGGWKWTTSLKRVQRVWARTWRDLLQSPPECLECLSLGRRNLAPRSQRPGLVKMRGHEHIAGLAPVPPDFYNECFSVPLPGNHLRTFSGL